MASNSSFSTDNSDNQTQKSQSSESYNWVLRKFVENANKLNLFIKSEPKTLSYQTNTKLDCEICSNLGLNNTHKMKQQHRKCSNEECSFKFLINTYLKFFNFLLDII